MMRSPPPPVPAQSTPQSHYGSYQGQQNGAQTHIPAAYNGFINDPTAQMGFQVGKTAVMAGQEYVERNVRVFDPKLEPFSNDSVTVLELAGLDSIETLL
jgi:hypothetical protein